jgi:hypothetical protein
LSRTVFSTSLTTRIKSIDWRLLVFLLLLVNVKWVVKLVALLLIYLFRFHFKLGLRWRRSRLPLFYPLVMGIAVVNWLLSGGFWQANTTVLLLAALFGWGLCLLAAHQVKLSVERQSAEVLHRTLWVFFMVNVAVSLLVFAGIVWETGTLNPYRWQGDYQKYFIGTGDYIKGISFDTSTTNAVLNAFGVVYFLHRYRYGATLLCMGVLLLTGSNLMTFLSGAVLLCMLVFRSNRAQKSIIVVCCLMMVVFWGRISPQNNKYVTGLLGHFTKKTAPDATVATATSVVPLRLRPDSVLNEEDRRQKRALLYLDSLQAAQLALNRKVEATPPKKLELAKVDIHAAPFQHKTDTTDQQRRLINWMRQDTIAVPATANRERPGKLLALQQVLQFVRSHPARSLTGAGAGHFSSRLAFRATGRAIAGGYPQRFIFVSPYFKQGHLALYLQYFTQTAGWHSVVNSPNSVYGQILGEYGLLGLLGLLILYWGFFARHYRKMTYGLPLLLLLGGVFFMDYWFEQLSVLVVAELLLFLNIKEGQT